MTARKSTLLVASIIAVFLIVGISSSFADINGDWALTFTWEGSGPGQTGLHIQMRSSILGNFSTDDGASGPAIFLANQSKVLLLVRQGCRPVYQGLLNPDHNYMEGTMQCRTSSGKGVWNAQKIGGAQSFDGDSKYNSDGSLRKNKAAPSRTVIRKFNKLATTWSSIKSSR